MTKTTILRLAWQMEMAQKPITERRTAKVISSTEYWSVVAAMTVAEIVPAFATNAHTSIQCVPWRGDSGVRLFGRLYPSNMPRVGVSLPLHKPQSLAQTFLNL
jgi:hypothetical protein